ncbi:putative enzyme related to lactoylglutathione lyase [Kribbella sp. VKM Ac-2527]|uniref:Putative enzyme related to lactoylglutathione lyase n=1 Tax=Kribbella caucasensis TaxID=2512215 RepID=A0A4R6KP88_9ACTN|nr:VOC family protein [Kribbella sp. VKM Ac-2527]TDO54476.1 putative enzyme related to lactoylglutathione lyase [Kribbella sp. VKM Ac-2527]
MMRGFATVSFYAADMSAAKAWYTELLGIEPYFARPEVGDPAYLEFRFGDYQCELGIIDAKWAPHSVGEKPAGAIVYWHVDDLEGMVERLLELGATQNEPITARGDTGFRTASVVDPFGNIIGVMYNPHYLEILDSLKN